MLYVGIIIIERGHETWHAHVELDNKISLEKETIKNLW